MKLKMLIEIDDENQNVKLDEYFLKEVIYETEKFVKDFYNNVKVTSELIT